MFISLCASRMAFLTDPGYSFCVECNTDKYERIAWTNNDIRITLEHTYYEFCLELSIYIRGKEVDVDRFFNDLDIPCRSRYEYWGAGMEKGVEFFAAALDKLINDIYLTDKDGLMQLLEKTLTPPPAPLHEYYLTIADRAYLSGDFHWAARFYKLAEGFMTGLQKKRYARALSKIR